ncbi:uncharacterized protein METZ01_LOCUS440027, partial [marine metagenome]
MSHPANEALADQCADKAIDELKKLGITEETVSKRVSYEELVETVCLYYYEYYMERDAWT